MFSWGLLGQKECTSQKAGHKNACEQIRHAFFLFFIIITALFVRNRDCFYPPSPPLLSLAHRGVGVLDLYRRRTHNLNLSIHLAGEGGDERRSSSERAACP